MPVRTMIDTDNLDDLDGHFELLATYADLITTEAELKALQEKYPHSTLIFIDRGLGDPLDLATVADIETGSLTIADLPGWKARKEAAGKKNLTGYCNRSNLAGVLAIVRHGLFHWLATLDGTAHYGAWKAMRAPAAIQILGAAQLGIHADLSLVFEDDWHAA